MAKPKRTKAKAVVAAKRQANVKSSVKQRPPPFKLLKGNKYFRRLRALPEDEVPVCSCFLSEDGTGCWEDCLNRLTQIECTPGTCPCGSGCQNQRIQQSSACETKLVHMGEKGWGLVADQFIHTDSLIMEYIGEVLNAQAAEERANQYEAEGQQHTYIMNLSADEVIDATKRGGLARFINHSCYPNCQTQKWFIKGEIRIGIFSIRDIRIGEELSYNYNLDWNGGKRVKCECGASNCIGFLGAQSKEFKQAGELESIWDDYVEIVDVLDTFDSDEEEGLQLAGLQLETVKQEEVVKQDSVAAHEAEHQATEEKEPLEQGFANNDMVKVDDTSSRRAAKIVSSSSPAQAPVLLKPARKRRTERLKLLKVLKQLTAQRVDSDSCSPPDVRDDEEEGEDVTWEEDEHGYLHKVDDLDTFDSDEDASAAHKRHAKASTSAQRSVDPVRQKDSAAPSCGPQVPNGHHMKQPVQRRMALEAPPTNDSRSIKRKFSDNDYNSGKHDSRHGIGHGGGEHVGRAAGKERNGRGSAPGQVNKHAGCRENLHPPLVRSASRSSKPLTAALPGRAAGDLDDRGAHSTGQNSKADLLGVFSGAVKKDVKRLRLGDTAASASQVASPPVPARQANGTDRSTRAAMFKAKMLQRLKLKFKEPAPQTKQVMFPASLGNRREATGAPDFSACAALRQALLKPSVKPSGNGMSLNGGAARRPGLHHDNVSGLRNAQGPSTQAMAGGLNKHPIGTNGSVLNVHGDTRDGTASPSPPPPPPREFHAGLVPAQSMCNVPPPPPPPSDFHAGLDPAHSTCNGPPPPPPPSDFHRELVPAKFMCNVPPSPPPLRDFHVGRDPAQVMCNVPPPPPPLNDSHAGLDPAQFIRIPPHLAPPPLRWEPMAALGVATTSGTVAVAPAGCAAAEAGTWMALEDGCFPKDGIAVGQDCSVGGCGWQWRAGGDDVGTWVVGGGNVSAPPREVAVEGSTVSDLRSVSAPVSNGGRDNSCVFETWLDMRIDRVILDFDEAYWQLLVG